MLAGGCGRYRLAPFIADPDHKAEFHFDIQSVGRPVLGAGLSSTHDAIWPWHVVAAHKDGGRPAVVSEGDVPPGRWKGGFTRA